MSIGLPSFRFLVFSSIILLGLAVVALPNWGIAWAQLTPASEAPYALGEAIADDAPAAVVVVDDDSFGSVGNCDDMMTPASSTIGAGITAAAVGDTVQVCPGTYVENVTLNKDITLNGAQAGVDARGRISANEAIIAPAAGIALQLTVGSAGATIDGFTMSGGTRGIESAGGPIDNVQILNNRVVGFTGNGIFLNDTGSDMTINRNSIDGASKTGTGGLFHLDQDAFHGFHFTNNWILGKGATDTSTGFFVDGNHNVSISATMRNPLISGNLINGCNTGMNLGSRAVGNAALANGNAPVISNNTFSNSNFDGLQGGMQNTLITGNTFLDNNRSGLALTSFGNAGVDRGAQNTDIISNTFIGNGGAATGEALFFTTSQAVGTIATN